MCGRFTLTLDPVELREAFDLGEMPTSWIPRYNIAPSQPVAVVTDIATRNIDFMRWGLVPSWAKDISIGNRLINARAETLAEKPSFRAAFARRRCLILADGFFEWKKAKSGPSTPFYIQMEDKSPFAFAGLWELWHSPEGDELKSCTIITCPPNARVAPIHDRMPVIFDPRTAWGWLEDRPVGELTGMLKAHKAEDMIAFPISRMVNDPKRDEPAVIKPLESGGLGL
jgi:putative SOS response-associated peptidase YedK